MNFMGTAHQASESVARSSYGPGGGLLSMGGGIGRLNQQNLGGLGGGNLGLENRRSMGGAVQSDVGSMYRGGNMQDEDALSHFMGQSDYGGAPTEVGV